MATGLILEFEFGTNWSNYSWFVGDIFGAPLLSLIHIYMDGKAIIGFVDGTENPAVDENPYHFAVVGEEDADFAG